MIIILYPILGPFITLGFLFEIVAIGFGIGRVLGAMTYEALSEK